MTHLPAILCALLVAGLLWGEKTRSPLRAVFKPGASLAFIAYGVTSGAPQAGPAGVAVMVALVLSAVGDVALLSRAKPAFLAGLGAFLLAHVGYIVAFYLLGIQAAVAAVALVPLGAAAYGAWRWFGPGAGSLAGAVLAYMGVITAMVAAAAGAAAAAPDPARLVLLAAAVVFYLSDLCVARDRFVAPGPANRYVGLPLYYGAQLLFAGAVAGAA